MAWQESKFEPRARSRSNALGLLQLKALTAGEVAGWFHEPAPGESALTDPALSLRYGTAYLGRLLARFGGSPAAALAAYNAGPSRLPPRWREYLESLHSWCIIWMACFVLAARQAGGRQAAAGSGIKNSRRYPRLAV